MPVKHPETAEVYRRILHDFMNPFTGFEPFGKSVGGVDHFNSSTFCEDHEVTTCVPKPGTKSFKKSMSIAK